MGRQAEPTEQGLYHPLGIGGFIGETKLEREIEEDAPRKLKEWFDQLPEDKRNTAAFNLLQVIAPYASSEAAMQLNEKDPDARTAEEQALALGLQALAAEVVTEENLDLSALRTVDANSGVDTPG